MAPRSTGATVRRAGSLLLAVAVALGALASTPAAGADALGDARARREAVRQERAAVAADLEVLGADRTELVAALDALLADAEAEAEALAAAELAATEADAAARRAQAALEQADDELSAARVELRDLAVGAFVGVPGGGGDRLSVLLGASRPVDVGRAALLAEVQVERHDAVVAEVSSAKDARLAALVTAERAVAAADERRGAVAPRAEAAAAAVERQQAFVATVEVELERRLSEVAALEALDGRLADQVRAEEEALAARLRAEAEARTAAAAAAAATASPTRAPTVSPGPPSGSLVRVGTIVVDASIGQDVADLLAAAHADGVLLGGGGFRDAAAQVARRADNCGTTPYDLYEKPATLCRPPTARPGHSEHERGLAIDFTRDGVLIGSRADPGYVWLAANAGRFGLRNLPSEPWHWSTTGA